MMSWFEVGALAALAFSWGTTHARLRPDGSHFTGLDFRRPTSDFRSHPIHVTYGRLQIEPTGVTLRIRMFKDDLEKALVPSGRQPKVVSPSGLGMDSSFTAYFGERIVLVADGVALKGTVSGSGTEQDMRWYSIKFPTSKPVHTLALSNRMFFELFNDQQNLLKVVDTASGEESSLYFVLGEPGPVTLTFNR